MAGGIGTVAGLDRRPRRGAGRRLTSPTCCSTCSLGLGLGLLAGLGARGRARILYDTIKTREDVRNKLGLACLGAIPKTAGQGQLRRGAEGSALGRLGSLFGGGRVASLQHRGGPAQDAAGHQHAIGRRQVVVGAGAGAEFRAARRVGAADRQRPAQAGVQGGVGQGRPDQAADRRRRGGCASHIVPTQFADLWLLPSGPLAAQPGRPAVDRALPGRSWQKLTSHFDIVIVDAPPVLGLADSLLLASVAGNVMFVVESGKTRTKAALEALRHAARHRRAYRRRDADQVGRGHGRLWLQGLWLWRARPQADRNPDDPA